jgi:hypothetical protein
MDVECRRMRDATAFHGQGGQVSRDPESSSPDEEEPETFSTPRDEAWRHQAQKFF